MPFFFELVNVWKAMLLAYGLLDKEQITYLDKSEYYCGEDGEWIIQLSELIKEYWDFERNFQEEYYEKTSIKSKEVETVVKPKVRSVDQQIADAEEHNRQFMKEHPELFKAGVSTAFGK